MLLIYTDNYKKTTKKLKKYNKEKENLDKIIEMLLYTDNFNDVINNPIFNIYGFERLKYKYNNYYSFNLNKNGGKIRLIVKPNENYLILYLCHISFDHYLDFNLERGVIDEK